MPEKLLPQVWAPQEAITFQVRPAARARRSERVEEAVSASLVGFDFPDGGEGAPASCLRAA